MRNPSWKTWYDSLSKSPLNPPSWVFGPAWTLLYCLMGVASYRVLATFDQGSTPESVTAVIIYLLQLLLNASWTPVFFGAQRPKLALAILCVLLGLVISTVFLFFRVDKVAGILMLPYVAWVGFASHLNYYIVAHNSDDSRRD